MSDIWLDHLYAWCIRQAWARNGRAFWPSDRQTIACRLGVGHSTETTGFPGYNGGAAAPHFTIDLVTGEVRQHVPLNWGSRCLAISAGGVRDQTVNITGVVQVEVIGAVTPGYPARYGHYDLPGRFPNDERAQYHLARLVRAIHDAVGIRIEVSGYAHYQAYPASYGARNARRLSSPEYRDAMGWIGHQHAPANDHGDGLYGRAVNGKAVDFEKALAMARAMGTAPGEPPKYEDGPNPDNNFGFPENHVREMQGRLNVLHRIGAIDLAAPLKEDGVLTTKTMAGVRSLQATLGFPKAEWDGLPGPNTTTHTEALMTAIETQLDRIEAKLDAIPDDVWAARIPFKEGTSLHAIFGPDFRAGAIIGYAGGHAFRGSEQDVAEIKAEVREVGNAVIVAATRGNEGAEDAR